MPAIESEKRRTRLLCITVNASMPELHKKFEKKKRIHTNSNKNVNKSSKPLHTKKHSCNHLFAVINAAIKK